ncbi:MAG: serine protease [Bacteroidetes bacterium]|nr:serine protease [Bacteroidota bacterium]
MFVKAIEEVSNYTRPIHFISRNYNETIVRPGSATLFFVNEFGCAVTCKHVVDLISKRDAINLNYNNFRNEKAAIGIYNHIQQIKELESKYKYVVNEDNPTIIQLKETFVGCIAEPLVRYKWINHPKYDLSIIIFEDFNQPLYKSYARFVKDNTTLQQGKFLCRLGYPFPEFSNFNYNSEIDDIEWTTTGIKETPRFPIEGMLTRHLGDEGKIVGLELSTPGLRGQSGGPLFNEKANVGGMQSSTNHLHLGFDMKNHNYNINGASIKINNQPFLHVGHCIHADVIKDFLKENGIKYYEEE